MSPLPERRKSAEELAELRKSLGITEDRAAGAPGVVPRAAEPAGGGEVPAEVARAVFEAPAEPLAAALPKPVRSLRKSERVPVERTHSPPVRADGSLPVRRHTERELMALRKSQPLRTQEVARQIERQEAKWPLLVASYGGGIFLLGLALFGGWARGVPAMDLPADALAKLTARGDFPQILLGTVWAAGGWWLLAAGWIAWRKPRSRHHAGFLTILAVLVLVFGTLYFLPTAHGA